MEDSAKPTCLPPAIITGAYDDAAVRLLASEIYSGASLPLPLRRTNVEFLCAMPIWRSRSQWLLMRGRWAPLSIARSKRRRALRLPAAV